jgi:putative ABC transport system permease protein
MNSTRLFRFLMRLVPLDFRSDYGHDIEQAFRAQRRDARTRGEAARIWIITIGDLFRVGPREHLAQLRQDLQYGLRNMRRQPGFVATAVLTLAVGIGVNTAMFSVIYAVLLRPLPYAEPDRLVAVWNRWSGQAAGGHSDPEFLDLQERSKTMQLAAAAGDSVNISGAQGDADRIGAAYVTTNMFHVLEIPTLLGRGFLPQEEIEARNGVVVLSNEIWRARFNSSATVLGQTLVVDGRPHDIVGVMGEGARLPLEFGSDETAGIILPLPLNRAASRSERGGHYLQVYGRLNDGVSFESASAEMSTLLATLMREYPTEYDQGDFGTYIRPLRDDLLGHSKQTLTILIAAVVLVLLLACANVANLLLARGEARRSELAVRIALGASRFRIIRQLVTEALALSATCALVGLAVAAACQKLLLLWLSERAVTIPRLSEIALNMPVLLFTCALAIVTGLLFGLFPALQLSHVEVSDSLGYAGRGTTGGVRPHVRRLLVATQVGIAAVLLIASGLLLKSFAQVLQEPSGFVSSRVLTFRVSLPEARYPGLQEVSAFYTRLLQQIAALPGIDQVGASSGLPMSIASGDWSFDVEGRPTTGTKHAGKADWYVITPGYFESLWIRLVRGRLPQESDDERSAPVIFINETTANTVFSSENPIGKRIRLTNSTGPEQPWRTIAGVVGDVRQRGLDTPPRTEMFIPHTQFLHFAAGAQARSMTVVTRSSIKPEALMPSIRAELSRLDPQVPAAQVSDMETVVSRSVSDRRMLLMLIGVFGWISIVLAAIGLYGVMDYMVLQRRREIGVRIAFGASRRDVILMVLRQAMRMVALGIAGGVLAAAALGSVLASVLYQVSPRDVAIYAAAGALLVLIGLLGSYLPARRAWRVDPTEALRLS